LNLSKLTGHKFALQFSGGKDSLACLHLLEPVWDQLIVLWGNPGDEFPELAEEVRKIPCQLIEVRGNAFEDASQAYPVDILPLRCTIVGRAIQPESGTIALQSKFECCTKNFWWPMAQKVKELGITLLIRGQRRSEFLRAPILPGSKDVSGAEIWLPINDWTQEDVVNYLKGKGIDLPKYYAYMSAGPKCMHCTAWLADQKGKLPYLHRYHPKVAVEYKRRMRLIQKELELGLEEIRDTRINPL
jgi:phosphoadenosine phosphosulfate reductase